MEKTDIKAVKVGIITHYYNSVNYGGLLQAYALSHVLKDHGFQCEQISYKMETIRKRSRRADLKRLTVKKLCHRIGYILLRKATEKHIKKRNKAISNFRENKIPHSTCIYTDNTIKNCVNEYDVFITGSDQVWNPIYYRKPYMLTFVPSEKAKLSYAASIGQAFLTEGQRTQFYKDLQDFRAISVREEDAVGLIEPLSPVKVEWVLDPTLLLKKEQWDELCVDYIINQPYLLCYFLGNDTNERKIAAAYARVHNLKLVTIPFVTGMNIRDLFWGNKMYDVSPEKFISLIKNAEIIFTDSFHAAVFSCIFDKRFFVFTREHQEGMSGRINSLVSLFGVQERFCNTEDKATLEYIEQVQTANNPIKRDMYLQMRQKSFDFLFTNLNVAQTDDPTV